MKSSDTCRGLRILLVGPYPPPFGGIASHLTTLIPGLVGRGADDIVVVSFGTSTGIEKREGFTLYRVNAKQDWRRFASLRSVAVVVQTIRALVGHRLGVRSLIGESIKAVIVDAVATNHRSQVVSFYQSDSHLESLPLRMVWGTGRSTVLTVFGEVYDNAEFVGSHRALYRELLAAPAGVLSSSKHCARSFESIGVTRPIEAVYYGVNLDNGERDELRTGFRNTHGIGHEAVSILFMGRFHTDMGLDVLIEAAPSLIAGNDQICIVIAGAKGELSVQTAALAVGHPGRIFVMENVSFSQQPALYAAADVLVAPSYNQRACMGMSIKEAMAASLPVVAGAGGGVPEAVVEGETGFLVGLGQSGAVDVGILVERILTLAASEAMRARFGAAGRRRAEDLFSLEATNQRLAEIFMSGVPR